MNSFLKSAQKTSGASGFLPKQTFKTNTSIDAAADDASSSEEDFAAAAPVAVKAEVPKSPAAAAAAKKKPAAAPGTPKRAPAQKSKTGDAVAPKSPAAKKSPAKKAAAGQKRPRKAPAAAAAETDDEEVEAGDDDGEPKKKRTMKNNRRAIANTRNVQNTPMEKYVKKEPFSRHVRKLMMEVIDDAVKTVVDPDTGEEKQVLKYHVQKEALDFLKQCYTLDLAEHATMSQFLLAYAKKKKLDPRTWLFAEFLMKNQFAQLSVDQVGDVVEKILGDPAHIKVEDDEAMQDAQVVAAE